MLMVINKKHKAVYISIILCCNPSLSKLNEWECNALTPLWMQNQFTLDRKEPMSLPLWSRRTFFHQELPGGAPQTLRFTFWKWSKDRLQHFDIKCVFKFLFVSSTWSINESKLTMFIFNEVYLVNCLNVYSHLTGRTGWIRSSSFKEDLHRRKCCSEIAYL